MRTFFTLCVLTILISRINGQAVLNEVYCQPGNGYNEFFELYNQSSSPVYEKLDNYTLVTYYEESGGKSGFYVLDFPNDSIGPQGFYAAASQLIFNIQGQPGLVANSDWNALGPGGSLTKWEKTGGTYTSVAVPPNLNDLFVKITGAGGVFHIFLYKNGILVNGVIAGQNSTVMPPYIKAMPDLFVDMTGSSPDFTIQFSTLPDNSVEYISSSAGTNNGYYREYDGLCGMWLKSDQPGQHNPGSTNNTNGNVANGGNTQELSMSAVISQYVADTSKSILSYNIYGGPFAAFPVIVEVYLDSGTVAGEWDINDPLFDTRTITDTTQGSQDIILPDNDIGVIIVLKSPNDCYNKTLPVGSFKGLLPVEITSFNGNRDLNESLTLGWTVANNQLVSHFEVERSIDGGDFKTVALVMTSEKNGDENYMFKDRVNNAQDIMYRLKMFDNRNEISFSKTLVFRSAGGSGNELTILGNPVRDKLTFSYQAGPASLVHVVLYDMNGKNVRYEKLVNREGENIISLSLNPSLKPGMYVLEINNGTDRQVKKFIKQ